MLFDSCHMERMSIIGILTVVKLKCDLTAVTYATAVKTIKY